MAEPATDLSLDPSAEIAAAESEVAITGRSPGYLAWRRLRRNYTALGFLGVFILIVLACSLAGVYARHIAHTGPNANHITEQVKVGGIVKPVMSQGGTFVDPKTGELRLKEVNILGPTWWHAGGRFVLGADGNGRDMAVRLLYGGRNSLVVGIGSALICMVAALVLALLAGYYGGAPDWIISRFFDLIWAFPVILLAIALGTALSVNGFHHDILGIPVNIEPGNILIPTFVIAYVLIPYVGRPLRGQILSLREKEFIEAATAQGANPLRIMFGELVPNIASSLLVLFTLIIASNILTEAALSFLGAGVQPPEPSWGNLISDGQQRIVTAPWLVFVPGLALVLTVLSMNIFGDGLRDAIDPRAKVKVK